uniref:Cytochrome P450 n=1 Tax=Chenopodium quinoa TaxID=63459 RepID=A0A803M4S8_CHEQI
MEFRIIAIVLLCSYFAAKVIYQWLKPNLHTPHKLPPGPPRWPLFGNLLQLGSLPHRDFASFCEKYGPLVYLKLGNVGAITTNDPEIIREILVRQDEVFASRPQTLAATHLAYNSGDVALAPMGPKWKRMRRICMEHLLTTKRLELFVNHRAEEAQHLIQDVWARSQGNKPINLRDVLGSFSMNNVTRMLLGKQYFGAGTAGPQEALEFMHITHQLFWLLGLIYLGDYLPIWRWVDPYGYEGEMDFVDVLLTLPGEDGKEPLEDVEIKALIQDMIAAATDTSAVTNEWAMAEVIKHPRVLHKIQQELDTVVGPNRMVLESDLPQLNYLRCVVRETFRMHPAGPFLIPHESLRPTTINGYDIPEGTRVFINTHGLGRNPMVWDNIEEFYPERHWSLDGSRVEISHGSDFKILPFSAGKRRCPGAPLGVVFVLMGLARLFHAFDWLPPDGMKPEEIDTEEVYGMTMPKAQPLMALAKPRLAPQFYL